MGKDITKSEHIFFFCDGGSCQRAGSEEVVRSARAYLRNNQQWNNTHTVKTRCNGRCEDAPTCIIYPGEFWYKELTPHKVTHILQSHLNDNCPLETELLYQKGNDFITSNNEIAPYIPKPFVTKKDAELGECLMTRGFSSEQYLYPLFLFLFENPKGISLNRPNHNSILFENVLAVKYSKKYFLEIITEEETIEFTIAPIPSNDKILHQSKVSKTEYYYQKETQQTGIRFKNKFGETLCKIKIGAIESKVWKYCTAIQLLDTNLNLELL